MSDKGATFRLHRVANFAVYNIYILYKHVENYVGNANNVKAFRKSGVKVYLGE